MVKTDKQIISYIANKIWSFNTDTEEDINYLLFLTLILSFPASR